MIHRHTFALLSLTLLTLLPAWHRNQLQTRQPIDFQDITEQIDQLSLVPGNWRGTESVYDFNDQWRARLDLHHHWSVQVNSPDGLRMNVLLMLSETGEQLYHTPEVCYAALGCEVQGESVLSKIQSSEAGEYRAVQVRFPGIGTVQTGVAVYGYWVDSAWVSPAQNGILNHMGHEPFLLKLQIMLENQKLEDPDTQAAIDNYLASLAKQLRLLDLPQ